MDVGVGFELHIDQPCAQPVGRALDTGQARRGTVDRGARSARRSGRLAAAAAWNDCEADATDLA